MKKINSPIPFDYVTVKTTKSRISYGFLTIPVSLIDVFPKSTTEIYLVNDKGKEEKKHFTSYSSKTRECRIYGLRNFFDKFNIRDGDEIVIQILDANKYRILPEKAFEKQISELEVKLEKSKDEKEIEHQILKLAKITNQNSEDVIKSEFVRLAAEEISKRKVNIIPQVIIKENVPIPLRKILFELYKGKCQVSNFTFLMKNNNPYFEIHHINPLKGNHFKNLLVVSPNVHTQFTFANIHQTFDNDGWLRKVRFNEESFPVFQIIDKLPKEFHKEIHS